MNRVGVILQKGLSKFKLKSVQRVYGSLLETLEKDFRVNYFYADKVGKVSLNSGKKLLEDSDIVFSLTPCHIARKSSPSVPFVYLALGSMPMGAIGFLRRLADIKNIDTTLFSCRSDRVILKKIFPKEEIGSFLLPFGVDRDVFKPCSGEEIFKVKEKYKIKDNVKLLLYAGRLNPQKNIHLLLKMFSEIIREEPNLALCIAGEEDRVGRMNGSYKEFLRGLVRQYKIKNRVVFTGNLKDSELASLYSAADIFITCTTNRDENFGFSTVEAMACGTPVICSKWGGLKDTVIEGKTGFFMDTALADKEIRLDWRKGVDHIKHLLKNESKRKQMSGECVMHVSKKYGLDNFRSNLIKAVRAALDRRNSMDRIVSGSKFEIHPFAYELLACIEYKVKKGVDSGRNPIFEDSELFRFFLGPYSSHYV